MYTVDLSDDEEEEEEEEEEETPTPAPRTRRARPIVAGAAARSAVVRHAFT